LSSGPCCVRNLRWCGSCICASIRQESIKHSVCKGVENAHKSQHGRIRDALKESEKSIAEYVVNLVEVNGCNQRTKDRIENSPGIPDHQIDGVSFSKLSDP